MPLPNEYIFTIQDIYDLPEGERAELIDGHIYYMAPPSRRHQRIVGELFALIREYIQKNHGTCEVNIAPFAVFLNEDDINYVEPDITVVCDETKLNEKGCFGAPDWIIEVVSPGSRQMDTHKKLFKYRAAGTREYWIVDPEKNHINVFNFEMEFTEDYTFQDVIKAGIYDDFFVDFKELSQRLMLFPREL